VVCDPDWWVAGFTGALFIATAGLWIVTGFMWWTTRRAVSKGQQAIAAAEASADAAMLQARASQRQADIAERSLTMVDRPWVDASISLSENINIYPKIVTASVTASLRNHGRWPAMNVSTSIGLAYTLSAAMATHNRWVDIAAKVAFGYGPRQNPTLAGMLAHGETFNEFHNLEIDRPEVFSENSEDDMVGLFVVICVSYEMPGLRMPRCTRPCGRILPR
jgi:hypothetical protein